VPPRSEYDEQVDALFNEFDKDEFAQSLGVDDSGQNIGLTFSIEQSPTIYYIDNINMSMVAAQNRLVASLVILLIV